MAGIAQVGVDTNSAGALISGTLQTNVKIAGNDVAIVGDLMASHGTGSHAAATIATGNSNIKLAGVDIAINGSTCSCSHPINSGSTTVTD